MKPQEITQDIIQTLRQQGRIQEAIELQERRQQWIYEQRQEEKGTI